MKEIFKRHKRDMFHIYWLAQKQTHRSTEQNKKARKNQTPVYFIVR